MVWPWPVWWHITYLSENSIELKFGRRLQNSEKFAYSMQKETEFQIESYLHYQGSDLCSGSTRTVTCI